MRYYVSWKTTGYYRKDSLKLAARCPGSGCWPSCSGLGQTDGRTVGRTAASLNASSFGGGGEWRNNFRVRCFYQRTCACLTLMSLCGLYRILCHKSLVRAALCNRADHCIFSLWFLLLLFFSLPNLSGRRLDVCHIAHMVWP